MLKLIIILLVGILALSYLGISLEAIAHSAVAQANFTYLATILSGLWNTLAHFVSSFF